MRIIYTNLVTQSEVKRLVGLYVPQVRNFCEYSNELSDFVEGAFMAR
jgi:hypothetical protein